MKFYYTSIKHKTAVNSKGYMPCPLPLQHTNPLINSGMPQQWTSAGLNDNFFIP